MSILEAERDAAIAAVQEMIGLCHAWQSSVDAIRSMYENEHRMREDESRRTHELIYRMVQAEMRADNLARELKQAIAARDEHYKSADRAWRELHEANKRVAESLTKSPEYRAMDKAQMLIEDADRYTEDP